MTDINSHSKRILRLPDVIARVRLCRASIYQRMADGSFPRSIPLGSRARGWLEGDIDAWVDVCIQKGNSEKAMVPPVPDTEN